MVLDPPGRTLVALHADFAKFSKAEDRVQLLPAGFFQHATICATIVVLSVVIISTSGESVWAAILWNFTAGFLYEIHKASPVLWSSHRLFLTLYKAHRRGYCHNKQIPLTSHLTWVRALYNFKETWFLEVSCKNAPYVSQWIFIFGTPLIANQPILVGNCEEISFACDYIKSILEVPIWEFILHFWFHF